MRRLMMEFRMYWHLFLSIGVLTTLLQCVQNESTIAPSVTLFQQTLMTMSSAAAVSSSSVSSSLSPESPTENKQASNPDNQETEETEAPLLIELWKIISIGGLLIVFILLIFILGLLMRNRLLKKALTRERRNTEERHQRQRRQMETREALSIIAAASSTNELSTFLHDEHGSKGQKFQSRTYSMGTSRSVDRLVDLLRNSEQIQRHHRSTDTLGDYDEMQFQPSRQRNANDTKNENHAKSTRQDNFITPGSRDDYIKPRSDPQSKTKVSFAEPLQETPLSNREEKQKDRGLPEGGNDEYLTSHDNSENQVNDSKKILSQVQAFEQAATTGKDGERARDTRKETRKEPKKLKHISFHNTSSQIESIAARKKREEEIRPLGGVVRRFTVNPFRPPALEVLENTGDEQ